jgi:hypothetical protein
MEDFQKNVPQVTQESIEAEFEDSKTPPTTKPKPSGFDEKHYLNTRLDNNEEKKTLEVRLLPIKTPRGSKMAVEVHTHNVKLPKNLITGNSKGWKSYICLKNTEGLDPKYGRECPFCQASFAANDLRKECEQELVKMQREGKEGTEEYLLKEAEKQKYFKVMMANISRKTYISRVIDRDHEEDGVKFWKYNDNTKKEGVRDQMETLYFQRKKEGEKRNMIVNIFDNEKGRDLSVTYCKAKDENTPPPQPKVVDIGFDCPISEDKEQQEKWLNDPKEWWDVFPAKPYEYLKCILEGKEPWFDKENNVWVPKEDFFANKPQQQPREPVVDNELSDFSGTSINVETVDSGILDAVTVPDELPF